MSSTSKMMSGYKLSFATQPYDLLEKCSLQLRFPTKKNYKIISISWEMKAITKYRLHLKLFNSFSLDLIVKKSHATYYFIYSHLNYQTGHKNKTQIISPYNCSSKSRRTYKLENSGVGINNFQL
jgi:hypothetical protein